MRSTTLAPLLLAAVKLAACSRAPPPPAASRPLELEFSGCAAVVEDGAAGACELAEDRTLRLWVRAPLTATLTAFASPGGEVPLAAPVAVGDGTRTRLIVPEGAQQLRIEARSGALDREVASTIIPLRPRAVPTWLGEARVLRQKGELDAAIGRARAATAVGGSAADRAAARGLEARVELGRGNIDRAAALFREAIALDREAGRISDAVDDGFALGFAMHQRSHRYAEARAALDEIAPLLPRYPDGRAREPYYRGILAGETGDRRAALRDLAEAEARATRLGLLRLQRNARSSRAVQLQAIGRAREALGVLRALEAELGGPGAATSTEVPMPCDRAEIGINLGMAALAIDDMEGRIVEDAVGPLRRAAGSDPCKDPFLRSLALANLALAELLAGHLDAARASLAESRASVKEPRGTDRITWLDVEGRIALAGGDPRAALLAFNGEERLAEAALLDERRWTGAYGRGQALEALGRREAAVDAYRQAEAVLDAEGLLVPLGEGRAGFLGAREQSSRAAVDLLVRLARPREALEVARRARGRVVATLAQARGLERLPPAERVRWEAAVGAYRRARAEIDAEAATDWRLPADELARAVASRRVRDAAARASLDAALAEMARAGARQAVLPPLHVAAGELTLAFHPGRGASGGWVLLAADRTGVTAHQVPPLRSGTPGATDPAELAAAVFTPIRARLLQARRVRVLASGAIREVDVHALPFEGQPLVARVPVEYPLDVVMPEVAAGEGARALVVADPSGDLPATRAEAREVQRELGSALQHEVRFLEGAAASSEAVLGALRETAWLHYAGHGAFAGLEGWESALVLAGGGRVVVGDILALPRAPSRVVLASCESAKGTEAAPEGLGLSQAFVLAGAGAVVAPARAVADALAARLSGSLYAALAADPRRDLAAALREAQRREIAAFPAEDWASFRVLVP